MALAASRRGFMARAWLTLVGSLVVGGLLFGLLYAPQQHAAPHGELTVYCAAGLHEALREITAAYQKEYGVTVRLQPDASGALLAKLQLKPDGADLYLAADESYMRQARSLGLVAEVLPVARQHAVIAVPQGNPQKIAGVDDLLREDLRVVLPNPKSAAVGRVAEEALTASGQWAALQQRMQQSGGKVSQVGSVTEAAQDVKVGTVAAAIVWDATARQFGLEAVEVPVFQKQTETSVLGVASRTARPTAALHLARYVTAADRGEPILAAHHFTPLADADQWADRPLLTLDAGAMLKPAVEKLLENFKAREGVDVNPVYAGCGILVAQMKALKGAGPQTPASAAPPPGNFPDAYFSCDVSFMSMVQPWFEAAHIISRNDMVLAVAKGNPQQVKSIADLARPDVRLGLGHPEKSALGALTDNLLRKLNLHEKVYDARRATPLVFDSAGHELVNKLRVGALDAIVVYRSNVLSATDSQTYLELVEMNLPEAVAVQPYAVAKDSHHKYLMRRLLEAILAPDSQKRFVGAGFQWIAKEPGP